MAEKTEVIRKETIVNSLEIAASMLGGYCDSTYDHFSVYQQAELRNAINGLKMQMQNALMQIKWNLESETTEIERCFLCSKKKGGGPEFNIEKEPS